MAKTHVIADEKLGGIEREYVEVDRRAEAGDYVWLVYAEFAVKVTQSDLDRGFGEYRTLEPTDIVVIDGERYRLVDRKAEVGDKVIVVNDGNLVSKGETYIVETPLIFRNQEIYKVLEPVEKSDKQLDHTANLALRVVELERAVKRLSDMAIKHDVDIHRLKHETEYLDETWRQTRGVTLQLSDELEALKCGKSR